MSTTIFPFIQNIMTKYVMSITVSIGLIGNILCCLIFFKQIQSRIVSAVYFLTLSIFANMYLIWSVTPLFYTLNYTDPQTLSVVYCKMRLYFSHIFGLYTRYSIVFGCVDLFLITHISFRVRSLSSMKIAYLSTMFMCLFGLIIASHLLIFLDIRGNMCGLFGFYKFFYPIYQFIIIVVVSSALMSIFGFLAVKNVQQRQIALGRLKRKDRDLMRMLVAEVLINIIASVPFAANLLYSSATASIVIKTAQRIEIDAFFSFFSQFMIQFIFISPFYLFIMSSKSFRHEFIQIMKTYWYKCFRQPNRVAHINRFTRN
ncbi:unnamed protein product [Adineta ricciae]|uniref:G-protein coupled receptors family 1 profile domain-containing protein n=1 Tax=Adineta ricciae TaxID=249248 RepID=A0A815T879_ADIRI|nr:unnamed protein product [Adineta ricciae]CAF1500256.1 unnamed protein product [Adineta ricciae]